MAPPAALPPTRYTALPFAARPCAMRVGGEMSLCRRRHWYVRARVVPAVRAFTPTAALQHNTAAVAAATPAAAATCRGRGRGSRASVGASPPAAARSAVHPGAMLTWLCITGAAGAAVTRVGCRLAAAAAAAAAAVRRRRAAAAARCAACQRCRRRSNLARADYDCAPSTQSPVCGKHTCIKKLLHLPCFTTRRVWLPPAAAQVGVRSPASVGAPCWLNPSWAKKFLPPGRTR